MLRGRADVDRAVEAMEAAAARPVADEEGAEGAGEITAAAEALAQLSREIASQATEPDRA